MELTRERIAVARLSLAAPQKATPRALPTPTPAHTSTPTPATLPQIRQAHSSREPPHPSTDSTTPKYSVLPSIQEADSHRVLVPFHYHSSSPATFLALHSTVFLDASICTNEEMD